jgi:hypothetical protein
MVNAMQKLQQSDAIHTNEIKIFVHMWNSANSPTITEF